MEWQSPLLSHFQEQQVGKLLDVIAIINAVMAQGVTKSPQFGYDVGHVLLFLGGNQVVDLRDQRFQLSGKYLFGLAQPALPFKDRANGKVLQGYRHVADKMLADKGQPLLMFRLYPTCHCCAMIFSEHALPCMKFHTLFFCYRYFFYLFRQKDARGFAVTDDNRGSQNFAAVADFQSVATFWQLPASAYITGQQHLS